MPRSPPTTPGGTDDNPSAGHASCTRQFALVLDEDNDQYADFVECCQPSDPVVWWGTETAERALLHRTRRRPARHRHALNAAAALERWERVYPVKLVWL